MRILRHLFVFSLLILAAVILRRSVPPIPALTQPQHENVQGESVENDEYLDVENNGIVTRMRWFKVEDASNVTLIPNYDGRSASADTYTENSCKQMFNGGFYDVDSTAIGLVVSEREELSPYRRNNLLNGIMSVNEMDTPRITRSVPSDPLVNAVQSGPVIWENGSELTVNVKNDENARRIVGAVTGSNELVFIALYNPKSVFLGPKLSELPGLISSLNTEYDLNIADAVNLDGGSASVFITPDFSLSEISSVGSFWCVK